MNIWGDIMISENGIVVINEIIKSVSNQQNSKIFRITFMEKLKKIINFNFGIFDVCKNTSNRTLIYDPVVSSDYNQEF